MIKKLEEQRDICYNHYINTRKLVDLIKYYNIKVIQDSPIMNFYKLTYKGKLLLNIYVTKSGYFISKMYDSQKDESEDVVFSHLRSLIYNWIRIIDIKEKLKKEGE
jgi:hypothetical protein